MCFSWKSDAKIIHKLAICKYFIGFLPINFPTALFSAHNNANKFAPAAHYSIITPSARRVSGGRMGDRRTTQPTRFGDALLAHTNAFSSSRSVPEVCHYHRRGTKKREAYRLPPRLLYYFFFLSLFKPLFNPDLTFFVALSTGLSDVDDELPPPFLASYSSQYLLCSASVPQTIFRPFALPFS